MSAYTPFLRTVSDMMRRYGGDGTLTKVGSEQYNPATSTATTADTAYTIRGLMFDYIPKFTGSMTERDSLIRSGDKQFIMKPDEDVPEPSAGVDKLTFGGITYSIVTTKPLNPSGTQVIYYELYLRE